MHGFNSFGIGKELYRYLFLTPVHATAVSKAEFVVQTKKGVAAVFGDTGTGKSSLARLLHQKFLDHGLHSALVTNPNYLGPYSLLCTIALELARPDTDERGFSRPFDGNGDGEAVCDIGAYESYRCAGDVNGNDVVEASDVRLVARSMHARPGSSRWNDAADVNRDSVVDATDLHIVLRARKAGTCG